MFDGGKMYCQSSYGGIDRKCHVARAGARRHYRRLIEQLFCAISAGAGLSRHVKVEQCQQVVLR